MRRSGVQDFDFDINTGVGWFVPFGDQPVDFSGIQGAVRESGFELLWLEAEVRGDLEGAVDPTGTTRPTVRLGRTGQVFWLIQGTTTAEAELYAHLEEMLGQPNPRVLVRGRVHPHTDAPPGLTVREFRRL